MKYSILVTIIFFSVSILHRAEAQTSIYNEDNVNAIYNMFAPSTVISEKKYGKRLLGSNYLIDEWRMADILLLGDTIEIQSMNIKVDLSSNVIEIQTKDGVKLLPSYMVKGILFKQDKMNLITRTSLNKAGPPGFYRVLYEGKSKLLCHYSTYLKRSNYNQVLDSGTKDDEIIQEKKYYYLTYQGQLTALESKKSKLINQLGDASLEKYIKSNRVNIKEEEGLVSIIKHIDDLNE